MSVIAILCGFLSLSCASANAASTGLVVKAHTLTEVNEESVAATIEYLDAAVKRGDKSVTLNIHSPGGSVWDGFELVQKIDQLSIPVVCIVDGYAASMAAVILEACDTRIMTARSSLMFHSASIGMCSGNEERMRNCAERLRVINEMMIVHCAGRLKMPVEEFRARVSGAREYWLTADEALKVNAVDKVISASH